MSIRLINTSREVIEFPTVQEAYDFVLSLDPPMAFRTDAPEPEKVAMRNKLHSMVNEIKQGAGIPGLSDMDADLISALAQSAESSESTEATGASDPSSSK
ncbi:hypothetical protein BGZ81_001340 [Podila clonocystis]|nr:hypothetical protein BGZ81_001340 [Podila clonocystis]